MKTLIITMLVLLAAIFYLVDFESMGSIPSENDSLAYRSSKNYDHKLSEFKNNLTGEKIPKKSNFNFLELVNWLSGREGARPNNPIPTKAVDLNSFLDDKNPLKVIWLGHSSLLLRFNKKTILIDPVFSETASPVKNLVQRFQKSIISLEELPKIDYIVISHDHYDHLCMKTAKYFALKETIFITPLGVGAHLKSWGVGSLRIIEKDWWEKITFGSLDFIATPARHFSGREIFNGNKSLWASWIIKSEKKTLFFSGDTGYGSHFKEIGDRFGPIDLAFIENGQYDKRWEAAHLLPDQVLLAYRELKARSFVPIHWAMFDLALHPWDDPILKTFKNSKSFDANLIAPKIGEIFSDELPLKKDLDQWWLIK